MTISASILTYVVILTGWLIFIPVLLLALRYAPYTAVARDTRKQHAVYAAIIVLVIFWLLEIQISAALAIHPLLVTATLLVFGWSLTTLIACVALLVTTALGYADWGAFPINALLTFIVPASVCWSVLILVNTMRFKNLFVYMLGAGFAGAAIGVAATGCVAALLFSILESPLLPTLELSSLPLMLLIMFPEAFINGTLVTAMTVFFPELVKTFDDRTYLDQ